MAELMAEGTQIVPAPTDGLGAVVQGDGGHYHLRVKEWDAAGKAMDFAISLNPQDPKWGPRLTTAAILKQSPQWKQAAFPYILYAVMYAENLGLDIMGGDVFDVGGRIATSNKAKIKRALASGAILGIETETVALDADMPANTKCVLKKDHECTVTLTVKGWAKPIVRKAKLSRWYKESNPNWRDNPEHMLELNTTAHACEYIAPGGTEGDEAPPLAIGLLAGGTLGTTGVTNDLVPALKASIQQAQLNKMKSIQNTQGDNI